MAESASGLPMAKDIIDGIEVGTDAAPAAPVETVTATPAATAPATGTAPAATSAAATPPPSGAEVTQRKEGQPRSVGLALKQQAAAGGGGEGKYGTAPVKVSQGRELEDKPSLLPQTPVQTIEYTANRMEEMYHPEGKQAEIQGRVRDTGDRLHAGAVSREQQLENNPNQFINQAKHNPRGNLNNMGYDETLRYSRLADIINNTNHWDPGSVGVMTGLRGYMQQAQGPEISRWEPIDTQEMRQMRANERMDERARELGIDLQGRVQEYPQELQEAIDKAVLDFSTYMERSNNEIYRFYQQLYANNEYQGTFQQFLTERLQRYLKQLDWVMTTEIGQWILRQAPSLGTFMASALGFGVSPQLIQTMFDSLARGMLQSGQFDGENGFQKFLLYFNDMVNAVSSTMAVTEREAANLLLGTEGSNRRRMRDLWKALESLRP